MMSSSREKMSMATVLSLCCLSAFLVCTAWKDVSILSLLAPTFETMDAPPSFNVAAINNNNSSHNKAQFVTFTRIPKTGSTSLLLFFRDYSGMESLKTTIDNPERVPPRRRSLNCMMGPMKHSNDTSARFFALNQCGHYTYEEIRRSFFRATGLASPFERRNENDGVLHVSIVRDPFDQLRSLFDYLVKFSHKETWKNLNTPAQYEQVRQGNFSAWLHFVFAEKKIPLGSQYSYFADTVDKAISIITGDSPNVTILLNECFETSLRLLEHNVALQTGAVDEFSQSLGVRSNPSIRRNETTIKDSASLEKLRQQSRPYLVDDYKFYNAAVEQFKRQISLVDASLLQGCYV